MPFEATGGLEPVTGNFSEPHAIGGIAGALVGDSIGSFHQFADKQLSDVEMDFCMSMPGGGPLNCNPGQVTDDGEMILCLMHALSEMEVNTIDVDKIVGWYRQWMASAPFDLEDTIESTFGKLAEEDSTT